MQVLNVTLPPDFPEELDGINTIDAANVVRNTMEDAEGRRALAILHRRPNETRTVGDIIDAIQAEVATQAFADRINRQRGTAYSPRYFAVGFVASYLLVGLAIKEAAKAGIIPGDSLLPEPEATPRVFH